MLLRNDYQISRRLGATRRQAVYWLVAEYIKILWCKIMGHKLVEDACAESGGGEIYCVRCGYQHLKYFW